MYGNAFHYLGSTSNPSKTKLAKLKKKAFKHLILCITLLAFYLTLSFYLLHSKQPYMVAKKFISKRKEQGLLNRSPNIVKANHISRKLNIVTQFPAITNGSDRELVLVLRQNEYMETLKKNLVHPQVENIHLLLENDHDAIYLRALNLPENTKIVYHFLNRRMLYSDAFRYVSNFLIKKTAVIMNADCFIGKGFEKLDIDILKNKNIYALTRHESIEAIQQCGGKDLCSPSATYIGSHDAFVVYLNNPLPDELLDKLMFRPNIVGVEKLVIFTLRSIGGFKVKNPCKILYVFHNHCSRLRYLKQRFVNGKRINNIFLLKIPRWKTIAPFSGL